MMKYVSTLVLGLALVLVMTATASAEDATRSATIKVGDNALKQARIASRAADKLANYKAAADKYIDARIASLNREITKINALTRISAADRAALLSDINTTITGLTTLKAKVDAETTADLAKTDIKSIFNDFKIFEVLEPKIEGLMMVGRFNFNLDKLGAAADKINGLISKAEAAGKDTTQMKSLYADYQAKIVDAKTQIAAAKAKFLAMTVTDATGARTLFQDGKALLKAAKTDIIAAHKDLQSIIPLVRTALGVKEASESAKPATGSGTTSTASGTH